MRRPFPELLYVSEDAVGTSMPIGIVVVGNYLEFGYWLRSIEYVLRVNGLYGVLLAHSTILLLKLLRTP
jgi:hypothetical protein